MGIHLPDELCIEAVRLRAECRTDTEAAALATDQQTGDQGITRSAFLNRLLKAAQRGLDGDVPRPIPPGQIIKGVSTLYDAGGNKVLQWVKTRDEPDPIEISQAIKDAFVDMAFEAPKVAPPETVNRDCLGFFAVPDLHMGLYSWGAESEENWDLKKATRVYTEAFTDLVAMTPRSGVAVLVGGGDQMHSDNASNRTEKSGNALDIDGRYERVLLETCYLFLNFALLLLQTNESLIIRIKKGNHDPHSSAAIAYFLLASFRNEPRVTVDVSPSLFWVHQFGKVMLAATHGHQAKPQQLPGIMAARWPEIWGATQFRYAHTFHVHHRSKYVIEDGGAIVETHQSPAPKDSWHYGMGFVSGRSLRSIIYHKELGEYGGFTRPVSAEGSSA